MAENKNTDIIEGQIINQPPKNTKKLLAPALVDIIMLALGVCLLIWADKVVTKSSKESHSLSAAYLSSTPPIISSLFAAQKRKPPR